MLIENDTFETELFTVLHLLKVLLIVLHTDCRLKVTVGNRGAGGIGWNPRIGHKVKIIDLHFFPFPETEDFVEMLALGLSNGQERVVVASSALFGGEPAPK
jgi:hypothetical protein